VYRVKVNPDGSVGSYKARLVVRGDRQIDGVNFWEETHASVCKTKSIRIMMALVAEFDLEFVQMDFEAAFLNAKVKSAVYIKQPQGMQDGTDRVCHLFKALYGLREAPRLWQEELAGFLCSIGWVSHIADDSVYVKRAVSGKPMLMSVHVDDVTGAVHMFDKGEFDHNKRLIAQRYKIKDLGDVNWLLNMCITRDRRVGVMYLDQSQYINSVLESFSMQGSKPAANPELFAARDYPMQAGDALLPADQVTHYRSIVGSLMYAACMTRPDIAHVVNQLTRYMVTPGVKHLKAAKHVLRYLSGTVRLGLKFQRSGKGLHVYSYSDADWAGDITDRKSTSGGLVVVSGTPVSWWSKKQKCVSTSTCEAEYVSLCDAAKECMWFAQWFHEFLSADISIPIYCDNTAAIQLSKNEIQHQRTKHIDISYHFLRDLIKQGKVTVEWVSTNDQLADILTKQLSVAVVVSMVPRLLAAVPTCDK
jgi:hypothetical protein